MSSCYSPILSKSSELSPPPSKARILSNCGAGWGASNSTSRVTGALPHRARICRLGVKGKGSKAGLERRVEHSYIGMNEAEA